MKFTLEENADATGIAGFEVNGKAVIEVENKTGVELPGTGGIGTLIFRVGGAALIILAAVLLVVKKRANNI